MESKYYAYIAGSPEPIELTQAEYEQIQQILMSGAQSGFLQGFRKIAADGKSAKTFRIGQIAVLEEKRTEPIF